MVVLLKNALSHQSRQTQGAYIHVVAQTHTYQQAPDAFNTIEIITTLTRSLSPSHTHTPQRERMEKETRVPE